MRVISCGEPLDTGLRTYLEEVFHVPVINFYGASESLAMGVEASKEEGMILFDDMNIIESINGRMYLTCLYNYAMPLIRYEITDRIDIVEASETDRCPFSRVTGLIGRNEDILWFTDNEGNREFLHPLAVEGLCIENLKDYQFRQVGEQEFELLAETKEDSDLTKIFNELHKELSRILSQKGLEFVNYQIRFVNAIAPNPKTGKKPLILANYSKTEELHEK
ncbi:Coenzyme F390 synthetase [Lachnospiraceae bacterium TWA4]|nr:Coenzyme F390 synthetase [Lachnospiraceae bacterium TWA4]